MLHESVYVPGVSVTDFWSVAVPKAENDAIVWFKEFLIVTLEDE